MNGGRRALALATLALLAGWSCDSPRRQPTNLVIVVLDTVRPDHLGLYGSKRPTSPHLDRWAGGAAVFDQALATSPWTLPSFGSLYTGRIPSGHRAGMIGARESGRKGFVRLREDVRGLPGILSAAGFATGAVVNNPYLHPDFGMARGFATYDYAEVDNALVRRADATVDRAFEWLDATGGRPFFLLVHFFDPHLNYDPPPGVRGRFTTGYDGPLRLPVSSVEPARNERDRAFVAAAYDEEIAFVDEQLGRLLAGLGSRGLEDSTLLFVLADHGEEFWDHGGFEHGHTLYQELLRIPLVAAGPGVRSGRHAAPVSITDVLPTCLEALGLPPEPGIRGRSLWGVLARGESLPERALVGEATLYGSERKALVRWPLKAVIDLDTRAGELFDLERDPKERNNLAGSRAARAQSLFDELYAEVAEASRRAGSDAVADLPERTREQLRSLGYLD